MIESLFRTIARNVAFFFFLHVVVAVKKKQYYFISDTKNIIA